MTDPLCRWTHAHILDLAWTMCLYSTARDIHVSGSIARDGAWEGHLVAPMLQALRAHPNSTLLDIGGNIGFYTLAAAAAGHDVHVFEPVPRNAEMILASVARNRLQDRVQLHTCGLSDASEELVMGENGDNQGGVHHRKVPRSKRVRTRLPAFRLDDILDPEASRPVYIKIDIEGGECNALQGMRGYLQGAARIIGVNMEFGQSRSCCRQWVAPGGIFDLLHTRHGLCPRGGIPYGTVCSATAWDLLWVPCDHRSPARAKRPFRASRTHAASSSSRRVA